MFSFFISVYNFQILSNSFMLITNRIITWDRICCMLLFISHTWYYYLKMVPPKGRDFQPCCGSVITIRKHQRTGFQLEFSIWFEECSSNVNLRCFILSYYHTEIASDGLKGRVFEVSLADLQNDEVAFRKFKLITEDVQGKNCLTNFHGMDLTRDKMCSMVKKWQVCKKQGLCCCWCLRGGEGSTGAWQSHIWSAIRITLLGV